MPTLSKTQISYLKQLAHPLQPMVMVGQHGLTKAVFKEIDLQLNAHELIKIKLPAGEKSEKQQALDEICSQCRCQLVNIIGRIGIVYRPAKKPSITLPKN